MPNEITQTCQGSPDTPRPCTPGRTSSSASDPLTLPRARARGWRGWVARALGTKIVSETDQERVPATGTV